MATTTAEVTPGHLERSRQDRLLFARTNLWIRTKPEPDRPSREATLVANIAQVICEAKAERQKRDTGRIRIIVLKARQEGISTWVAARIYHAVSLFARRRGMVLADKLDRAGEIFSIYEFFDARNVLRPPLVSSRKAREIAYATDSKLVVETAKDRDAGRGGTKDYVHASEFASWPYPADTLAGLLESIPANAGEAWIESTAKGVGNEFHAMWEAALQGESEWMPIFLPWWIDAGYRLWLDDAAQQALAADLTDWETEVYSVGIPWEEHPGPDIPAVLPSGSWFNEETQRWRLTLEQLAWRRRKIREGGELRFQQENPSTSEEAFLVSGSPFFDQLALKQALARCRPPLRRGNFVHTTGGIVFSDGGDRGFVRIWEDPDPDGQYVIGGDTAEGRMSEGTASLLAGAEGERGGRDFSSADVLKVSEVRAMPNGDRVRIPCLRQVAQVHGREGLPPDVFAFQVYAASAWWSNPGRGDEPKVRSLPLIGIERNHSSGQTTIRQLLERWRHPNLYIHHRVNRSDQVLTPDYGFVTDASTRPLMLDELEQLVRTEAIEIFAADTIREMRTFVRGGGKAEEGKADDGKPAAQKGCHDDRVISLAIGVQMRAYAPSVAGAAAQPDAPPPESLVGSE